MAKKSNSKSVRSLNRKSMKHTRGGGTGVGATGALLNSTGTNTWQGQFDKKLTPMSLGTIQS